MCVCVSKGGCSAATCATFGFRSPFFLWKLSCRVSIERLRDLERGLASVFNEPAVILVPSQNVHCAPLILLFLPNAPGRESSAAGSLMENIYVYKYCMREFYFIYFFVCC